MTRTERTYYAVLSSYNLAAWFMAPVYPLFLASRGLDLFQVNLVLVTYLVTVTVFEVPTGALADLFGRKLSFVLSCVLRMGAFGLYYFAQGFRDCVVAEAIDAVGTTLASGALDAWAVDGMLAESGRQPTPRLFARAQVIGRAMMIVGGVACGYVADRDIGMPWLIGASGFAVTGLLAAALMQERTGRSESPPGDRPARLTIRQTSVAAARAVATSPPLRALYGLSFALAFAGFTIGMTWPPRLQALAGGGHWVLGWAWAALNLAAVVGGTLAPRLADRARREYMVCAATLLRAAGILAAAFAPDLGYALAALVVCEVGFALGDPLLNAWVNEHVGSELRATVLSVRGMAVMLGGAVGLAITGLIARADGIPAAWVVCAVVFLVAAPVPIRLGMRATPGMVEPG